MEKEVIKDAELIALAESVGLSPEDMFKSKTTEKQTPEKPNTDEKKPGDTNTENLEKLRGDLVKEIFGDRFKTMDEVKAANISESFKELDNLRQKNSELESKLTAKPMTNFANDEVAIYNEFVKETGINNYGLFKTIKDADIANIDPMNAMVYKYVMDNPSLAGKEAQIKRHLEKKYNVDPNEVDEETLEINKVGLHADSVSAKNALLGIKAKLKVPEQIPPKEEKSLSEEEIKQLTDKWKVIGKEASTKYLNKINIPIKGKEEPLLSFVIDEDEQKKIDDFITDYAVENQMPLNEANVKTVTQMVFNQLVLNKLPEIVHSVFEKARQMTQEQVDAYYENPSTKKNNDAPPAGTGSPMSEFEKARETAFEKEYGA